MLCLNIKPCLQGFNVLSYNMMNAVTLLGEQVLLLLAPWLTWWILILKIIYWKWPVVVSPVQWGARGERHPPLMAQLPQNQTKVAGSHFNIELFFSCVLCNVVYKLLTSFSRMFDTLISKGFVSSQWWKSTVRLERCSSCILFALLKITL